MGSIDFLTGMAFWGILLLVAANALIVSRMRIEIRPGTEEEGDQKATDSGDCLTENRGSH